MIILGLIPLILHPIGRGVGGRRYYW